MEKKIQDCRNFDLNIVVNNENIEWNAWLILTTGGCYGKSLPNEHLNYMLNKLN